MSNSLALLFLSAMPVVAAEGLIQLIDPLDEPEFYCVDVPGFRDRLNLDAPLMAHTCKPGAADELYMVDHPKPGQLYMKAYDRCVEATSAEKGGKVLMKACSDSLMQRFTIKSDGQIELAGKGLCLTVADVPGVPTGGPSHLRRDLTLAACGEAKPALSRWNVGR